MTRTQPDLDGGTFTVPALPAIPSGVLDMTCSICGGLCVWIDQLELHGHAQCLQCFAVNTQEADTPVIAGRIGPELADVVETVWGPVEALWQEIGGEA